MQFTPEQQKVIDIRDKNILVSAAAGSGKTAVLVERIIGLILDEKNPVDIDKLLIVTFTNAAASEMRERIGKAIEQKLAEEPENTHLQKQATLLHYAQITTIDSFCLFVIRNNFNDIGLDPGFRVADAGEIELLKQDVMEEIFEELLEDDVTGKEFTELLEHFAFQGREKNLEEAILKIYTFSQSFPWPEEWLKERYQDYVVGENPEDTLWGQEWKKQLGQELEQIKISLQNALAICAEPTGPYMYMDALQSDEELIDLLRVKSWQEQYEIMQGISYARLSAKKDPLVSVEKKENVKAIRDEVKKQIEELRKKYYSFSMETIRSHMEETAKIEKTLIDTVFRFQSRFEERKREKNILDFNDMEHMALQILLECEKDENGKVVWKPTKTAMDYRSHFKEIMIDEYQDSNLVQEYLLQSISGELTGNHNRFMVGDLKQSIYKFRLARPEIFLEKYHSYSEEEDTRQQRVDLHKNFRSRRQVLESVNDVFYQIMGEDLGKIEYTQKEALYPGADYKESEENYTTELLVLDHVEKDAKKAEAAMIASRIRKMVGEFLITDKETGQLRPANYGDIVVLLRTNTVWDEEFCEVFKEYGIPAAVTSKTGYFSAKEVQVVMGFLKTLDNPRQEIPLYGTMKSLLGRFTEEEIVQIKLCGKENLYDNLKEASLKMEEELGKKAKGFLDKVNRYRDLVYTMPIYQLLRLYLKETGYLYYFAGLPGGEQRTANIKMLLEKAETYEKTSYFGLFYFIRYMEKLQKYDIDSAEAGTMDESQNVVRIMSIHKSKGLEFPICFVAGLSKRMNQQDVNSGLICDMELGIGLEYRNSEKRIRTTDLRRNVLAKKMLEDNLGEELRILYVAMTRAKEKLLLTATVKEYEKEMIAYGYLKNHKDTKLPLSVISRSNCFLDFILPVTARGIDSIETILWNTYEAANREKAEDMKTQISKLEAERILKTEAEKAEGEMPEQLRQNFDFQYPHKNLQGLYVKTSVSELKMKAMQESDATAYQLFEEKEFVPYVPDFIEKKEEVSGAARGDAYHRVMELTDFVSVETAEEVFEQMKQLTREQVLEESQLTLIRKDKIQKFMESALRKRMKKAAMEGLLWKEQPFVWGISAREYDEKFPQEEQMLIQGIIDVFFEEDGKIVVADYKTDAVKTPEELKKRYQEQLNYYAKALKEITGKEIKEKILYSFALNCEVVLE